MKKLAAVVLMLMSVVGCSSTCKDGRNIWYGYASDVYAECSMKCTREENPKTCRCSKKCSCWTHEAHQGIISSLPE